MPIEEGAARRVRGAIHRSVCLELCVNEVQAVSPAGGRDERKRTTSRAVAAGETPQQSEWYQRQGTAPRTITAMMDQL